MTTTKTEALQAASDALRNWKALHPGDWDALDERAVELIKAALATHPAPTQPDAQGLPEPELGYVKTSHSNQPAYSARQMREAIAQATQQNTWRDAMQEEFDLLHTPMPSDPREAIKRLLQLESAIALDPDVSEQAQALVQRGRDEASK